MILDVIFGLFDTLAAKEKGSRKKPEISYNIDVNFYSGNGWKQDRLSQAYDALVNIFLLS